MRGSVFNDTTGATIETAYGGYFSNAPEGVGGVIEENIAVYAVALDGTVSNYSFYGQNGKLFNNESIDGASYLIAGTPVLDFDGDTTRIAAPNGEFRLYLGDDDSPANYYNNTEHRFSSQGTFTGDFATIDATGVNTTSVFRVDGTQVVGNQGAAVADATDAASAITQLNALLSRLRAHGLIAT